MGNTAYLIAGDINIDIIIKGLSSPPAPGQEVFIPDMNCCLGGSAANTACALAKLGTNVKIWTKIANDSFGSILLQTLKDSGVKIDGVKIVDGSKSGLSIGLTNSSDRSFISFAGTNSELDFSELPDDLLNPQIIYIYLGLIGIRTCLDAKIC